MQAEIGSLLTFWGLIVAVIAEPVFIGVALMVLGLLTTITARIN